MKKLIIWILIIVLICSGCSQTKLSSSDASSDVASQELLLLGIGQTAELQNIKITALARQSSNGDDFFKPEPGNKFVGVKFEIENISDEDITISTLLLFNIYVDDVLTSYSLSANIVFDEGTLDGTIAPGKKLIGWIAVECPKKSSYIEIHIKDEWLSSNKAIFKIEIVR